MKKVCMFVALMVAVVVAAPVSSQEQVDKTLVVAAEKMLHSMPADFYQVEPAIAQEQMENAKPFLLDVRENAELVKGRIAGSVHIPIRELPKALARLPQNKSAPILTYCQVGYRGGMAVTILRMWGYTNVRTIKNGLNEWQKAGLPVEKSAA